MAHEYYKHYKALIKHTADTETKSDKAYRRYVLNNELDAYIREMDMLKLREQISEKQFNLYSTWLTNYVIKRHQK